VRYVLVSVAGAVVLVSIACGRSAPPWPPTVRAIASPAAGNTSEPQLTATDKGVILSWIERSGPTTTLKFAERTASGWTSPLSVAAGNDWFVSYADPPTVMRLSDGILVGAWTRQTDPVREAMDLQLSRSDDNGKTWSPPFTPHHDGTKTQHAFATLFEMPGKALGLVWLDGRETVLESDDDAGPPMTMRYAAFDSSWKQTADAKIAPKVCECCATAAAPTDSGIIAAYRSRNDKEMRDIYVTHLENGAWSTGTPVHEDNWRILACPVNGPAVSARGRTAAVAWFVAKHDEGHAYAAFSSDGGHSWGAPMRLDESASLGRVGINVLDDGSAVAESPAISLAGVGHGATSGFPRMVRRGNELVFAWTESRSSSDEEASMTVRTAIAALP